MRYRMRKFMLIIVGLLLIAIGSGLAYAPDISCSWCTYATIDCSRDYYSPAPAAGCWGRDITECEDVDHICYYCEGADWGTAHRICVYWHNDKWWCNSTGTPLPCSPLMQNKCEWYTKGSYCKCSKMDESTYAGGCTFYECTGTTIKP